MCVCVFAADTSGGFQRVRERVQEREIVRICETGCVNDRLCIGMKSSLLKKESE